eukprot:m.136346 g.136346  ORF g.136346 m.136346 type:complete len:512 (+) comp10632_c0_seq1:64-1599(+)
MEVVRYLDPVDFKEEVDSLLLLNVAENSNVLAMLKQVFDSKHSASLYTAVIKTKKGQLVACAFQLSAWHGMHILVNKQLKKSNVKQAMVALASHLTANGINVKTVEAQPFVVEAFADVVAENQTGNAASHKLGSSSILKAKKVKEPPVLVPGEMIVMGADECEQYSEMLHQFSLEEWQDDAPTLLQCSESLETAANKRNLFGFLYRDYLVCLVMVRLVSSNVGLFTNITTPHMYRNRGFGEALIHHVMKFLQQEFKTKEFIIHVEGGDAAIPVYERLGFSEVGFHDIYTYEAKRASTHKTKFQLTHSTISASSGDSKSAKSQRRHSRHSKISVARNEDDTSTPLKESIHDTSNPSVLQRMDSMSDTYTEVTMIDDNKDASQLVPHPRNSSVAVDIEDKTTFPTATDMYVDIEGSEMGDSTIPRAFNQEMYMDIVNSGVNSSKTSVDQSAIDIHSDADSDTGDMLNEVKESLLQSKGIFNLDDAAYDNDADNDEGSRAKALESMSTFQPDDV